MGAGAVLPRPTQLLLIIEHWRGDEHTTAVLLEPAGTADVHDILDRPWHLSCLDLSPLCLFTLSGASQATFWLGPYPV